jgi:hypothetical protein
MSDAGPEYSLAAEVHDVASARIVGAACVGILRRCLDLLEDREPVAGIDTNKMRVESGIFIFPSRLLPETPCKPFPNRSSERLF